MKREFWEAPMWLSSTDTPWASEVMKKVEDSGKADPAVKSRRPTYCYMSCSLETVIWKRKLRELAQLN